MPNCSNCGKYIQATEVYRREMYVGRSERINYGKRVTFGNSNHYRKQSICFECAKKIDASNERSKTTTTIVLLVIGIAVLLYFVLQ